MTAAPARCPKHGTLISEDDPPPWCWPCWSEDGRRGPQPDIDGACIAMSRFLVFVWLEAQAVDWAGLTDMPALSEFEPDFGDRSCALAEALASGLLRIDWGRS